MSSPPTAPNACRQTVVLAILGISLIAIFFSLSQTPAGLQPRFHPPAGLITPGDLNLWLSFVLLLTPGSILLGIALSRPLNRRLAALCERVDRLDRRQIVMASALFGLFAFVVYRIGRAMFLLDFPVTDDEYGARFGGQILALGRVAVPEFKPLDAIPGVFFFVRDGVMTSFEYLGVQLAWAAAELTGSNATIFTLCAALTVPVVGAAVGYRLGRRWGLVAAACYALSPMVFLMSLTAHAQILSRAFVALTLLCYVRALATDRRAWWFGVGATLSAAFLCRPPETLTLFAPLLVAHGWQAIRRQPGAARAALMVVLGVLPLLLLFFLHNAAITGNPLVMPRANASTVALTQLSGFAHYWWRMGANLGYNLTALLIWCLGLPGLVLVLIGTNVDRFTRLLTAGVVVALLLALAHDHLGLHIVGPIHYSEAAVFLLVIAVHGLAHLKQWCTAHQLDFAPIKAAMTAFCAIALGTFTLWHGPAFHRSAQTQARFYAVIDAAPKKPAVVLAPPYGLVWTRFDAYRDIGGWVFEWRRPRPDFADDVLILNEKNSDTPALRQRFPNHTFYRLVAPPNGTIHLDPF